MFDLSDGKFSADLAESMTDLPEFVSFGYRSMTASVAQVEITIDESGALGGVSAAAFTLSDSRATLAPSNIS